MKLRPKTTKETVGEAVEAIVQRARCEVIDACRDCYDDLPEEVQERMKIFNWLDDQSYPDLENQ